MKKTAVAFLMLVIIIAFLIIGLSVLSTHLSPNPENIVLTSWIRGCAESETGTATRSLMDGAERPPVMEIQGDRVVYSRAIHHLCCRKVVIEKEITNSTITLYETWSGPGCRCICFSKIEATLSPVPQGSCFVNVYERGMEPGGVYPMEIKLIISWENG